MPPRGHGQGFKSAFFSIEVTDEEAALQAAAQQAHISLGRIDAYTLNSKESGDLEKEMMSSADLPFYIVGFGNARCPTSGSRPRRWSRARVSTSSSSTMPR
jgi:replicative DNA helicase